MFSFNKNDGEIQLLRLYVAIHVSLVRSIKEHDTNYAIIVMILSIYPPLYIYVTQGLNGHTK